MSSEVSGAVNFFVSEILAIIGEPSDLDRPSPQAPEALLIGGSLPENTEKARAASPINYVSPNDPPVLTIHGTADLTVPYDQAVRLNRALTRLRVPSYFIPSVGTGHSGGFADEVVDRAGAFFSKVLLGKDVAISTETLYKRESD